MLPHSPLLLDGGVEFANEKIAAHEATHGVAGAVEIVKGKSNERQFHNGVLEITMPAPKAETSTRKLEIKEPKEKSVGAGGEQWHRCRSVLLLHELRQSVGLTSRRIGSIWATPKESPKCCIF